MPRFSAAPRVPCTPTFASKILRLLLLRVRDAGVRAGLPVALRCRSARFTPIFMMSSGVEVQRAGPAVVAATNSGLIGAATGAAGMRSRAGRPPPISRAVSYDTLGLTPLAVGGDDELLTPMVNPSSYPDDPMTVTALYAFASVVDGAETKRAEAKTVSGTAAEVAAPSFAVATPLQVVPPPAPKVVPRVDAAQPTAVVVADASGARKRARPDAPVALAAGDESEAVAGLKLFARQPPARTISGRSTGTSSSGALDGGAGGGGRRRAAAQAIASLSGHDDDEEDEEDDDGGSPTSGRRGKKAKKAGARAALRYPGVSYVQKRKVWQAQVTVSDKVRPRRCTCVGGGVAADEWHW